MGKIFEYIAIPFGYLMKFCVWISPGHNYLIALIFFTLIIQVLLAFAFGIKQQKNMIKQAMLAPKAAAIRKKYAGREDQATRQKLQEETQELYRENGYSPLGGCLPMLIQLPIIMSLYYVIVSPLQYMYNISQDIIKNIITTLYEAGNFFSENVMNTFATEIEKKADYLSSLSMNSTVARTAQYEILTGINGIDLTTKGLDANAVEAIQKVQESTQPSYTLFGFDFSHNPTYLFASDEFKAQWLLILVPILIVASMIVSQLLSKKFTYQDPMTQQAQNGCSMKAMLYAMPLLSAWISFSLPAAVGVYWIYRSLAATLQQFIFSKIMPLPKFTEEDYKAAEKELNGTSNKKKKKEQSRPTGNNSGKRSLHHIDDEDDETPVIVEKKAEPVIEAKEPEISEKTMAQAARLNGEDVPVIKDDKNTHYEKK